MATNLATSQSITGGLIGKSEKKHRLKQRFEVTRKLGQGTYGKVQLAVNKATGKEVAIKTIKKSIIKNENDLVRIRREIQIMSSIEHPNIIHIYEVFENKDKIVLVMQYARGGELYEYVNERKKLSDDEARRIFRQIATAIYYCHKNKVCHRDLKLENILLDEKRNAKIGDFGLSNVFDLRNCLNTFCGSLLYASPEIVKGAPYYGPEVDCWSLGVLLYTLVYGAMPFANDDDRILVKLISKANYLEPKIKSEASDLIKKLLCVQPNKRATIIDICTDAWVNKNCERSLLQVAEDLANLTPVKIEVLLALAPISQPNKKNVNENSSRVLNEKEQKISVLEPPSEEPVKRKKSTKKSIDKDGSSKKNKLEKENEASKVKIKTVTKDNNNNLDEITIKTNKNSKLSKSSLNQDSDYVSEELNSLGKKPDDKKSISSISHLKSTEELSLNDTKNIKTINETNIKSSDKLVQPKLKNDLDHKNDKKTKETNKFLVSNNEEKISLLSNLTRKPSTKTKTNKSSLYSNSTNKDNCLNKDNKALSGSNEIKKIDDDQSTKNSFQVAKSQSKIGDAKRLFEKPRRQDSSEGEKQERIVVLNKVSDVKNKFERRASVNTTNSSVWKNKTDNQPELNEIHKKTLSKNPTAISSSNNDLVSKNPSLNEKTSPLATNSSIKNSINDKNLISKPKLIERLSSVNSTENDKAKTAAQLNEKTNLKMRRHTVKAKTSDSPSVTLAELKRKSSNLKEKIPENLNNKQNDAIKNENNISNSNPLIMSNNKTEIPSKKAIEVNIVSRSTTPTLISSPVHHKSIVELSASKENLPRKSYNSPTHTSIIETPKFNFKPKVLNDKKNASSLSIIKPTDDILPTDLSETSLNLLGSSSNFAPIARSYKKISFTKDGATIMETGKIISEETPSGTKITKKIITKKSKTPGSFDEVIETRNNPYDNEVDEFNSLANEKNKHFKNKFDSFTKSNIKKSDSTSSSGSIDVFDDIFDTWVGDPMFDNLSSKLKSFFSNQPNSSSSLLSNNSFSKKANFPSFLNKTKSSSTNKRAESCERKLNDEQTSSLISGNNSNRNFFRKAGYSTEGESDTDNEEAFPQNVGLWKYLTPNSLSSRLLNRHRSILNEVDFFNDNFSGPSMLSNPINRSRDRLKFDSKPPTMLYNRIKSASREFFEPNDTVYKTTYLIRPDGSKKSQSSSHKNQENEFSDTNVPLNTKLDRINSNQYSELEMEINPDFRPNLPLTLGRFKPQNLNSCFNRSLSSKPPNNSFLENTALAKQRVYQIPIEREKTKTEYFIPITRQASNSFIDMNPDNSSLLDQLRTHGYRNLVNQRNSKQLNPSLETNNSNTNEENDQINYLSSSNNSNGSKHKQELFNLSENYLIKSKTNKTDNYSLLINARNKSYLSSKNYPLFTKSETLDQLNCNNIIKKAPLLKHFSSKTKENNDIHDDENEIIIYGSDEDDSQLKRQVLAQNKLLKKNNYDSKKKKLGSVNNLISQNFENGSQIYSSLLSDYQKENLNKKQYKLDLRRRKSTSDKLYSFKDEANKFEDYSESLNNSSDSVFHSSTTINRDTDELLSCSINNQVNQIQHLIKLLYSENDEKKSELSEKEENKFLNKMNKGTDKILQKTQFDLNELKSDLEILQLKNKFQRRMKTEILGKNDKCDLKTKEKKLSNTDSFLSTSTETSSTNTVTPTSEEEDDSMFNKTSNLYKSLPPLPPGQNRSTGLTSSYKLVNLDSKNSLNYTKQLKLIDQSDQLNDNLIKSNLRTFASNGDVLVTKNSKLNDQNHLYQTNLSCSTLNREHGMFNKSSSSINFKSSFSSCRSSSSLIGISKPINPVCQTNKNNELTRRSTVSNGSPLSSSKETLQERILRKSFYSRFNSPDRSLENNLYQQKKINKKSSFYFNNDTNETFSKSYSNLNEGDSLLNQETDSDIKINNLILKRSRQTQSPLPSNLNLENSLKVVNRRNSFSYGSSKTCNSKPDILNPRNLSSKINYSKLSENNMKTKNIMNDNNYQNEILVTKNYSLSKNHDDNNNFYKNVKSLTKINDISQSLIDNSSKLSKESFSKIDLNNLEKNSSKNQIIKRTNSFKKNEKKNYSSNYIKLST